MQNEIKLTTIAALHHALHWLIIGLIIPVLAIFQLDRGLSLFHVGLNASLYSLATFLLEVPTGGLADAIGRRKVYFFSLVLHGGGAILLIYARSAPLISVCFLLMGASRALSSGCMDAYFIDAFNRLEVSGPLQRFLGRIGIVIPLTLAVGGLLGGLIAGLPFQTGLLLPDKYALLFAVQALVVLLQAGYTFFIVPAESSIEAADEEFPSGIRTLIRTAAGLALQKRVLIWILVGVGFWGVAFAGLEQFWQPFLNGISHRQSPTRLFGLLTAGYFLMGSLGAVAANRFFALIGERYALSLFVIRIVSGLLFVILSLQSGVVGFAIFYFLIFLLNGIADSPEQALFNRNVPDTLRSTMLSVQSLFLQVGGGLAALAWGWLAQVYSIGFIWRMGGLLFAASAIVYLLVRRHEGEKDRHPG